MVEIYSINIGGVDLCSMMLSNIALGKVKQTLYVYNLLCFGISFTNPWLIYRRHVLTQHFQKAVIHIVSVSKPNSK